MADERIDLQRDVDQLSVTLFGITETDTLYPPKASMNVEEWNAHFEFLQFEYEEEALFWKAFGLDLTDADGEMLLCIEWLGRALVCALKRLHPAATLKFMPEWARTEEQLQAEAEVWGARLLAHSSQKSK